VLVGREEETRRLRALVDIVSSGTTGSLLVVGEAGTGKSALLESAVPLARNRGLRVVAVTAVESESRVPGALLDLIRARLGRLRATVPVPAVRGLLDDLVAVSDSGPLLVVVDDVHWLEGETSRAVTFALRRLLAEPVGLLLAARPEPNPVADLTEVPRLVLTGLAPEASISLLLATTPAMSPLTAAVVARALGGVPLALVESAGLLTDDQLRGRAPLTPVQVGPAIQQRYAVGFAALPAASRVAATVLAAGDGIGPAPLGRALRLAGVGPADLRAAEEAGLVRLGAAPTFVHPLARSSVYSAASPARRREAHRAWAAAAREAGDRHRELRHRSAAAEGPDEALAHELEVEAARLACAGLLAEASGTAEAAAELSESAGTRCPRLVLAAETCGDVHRTRWLVDQALASEPGAELAVRYLLAADVTSLDEPTGRLDALIAGLDLGQVRADLVRRLDVARVWAAATSGDVSRLYTLTEELDSDHDRDWKVTATVGVAHTFVGDHRRGVSRLRAAEAFTRSLPLDEIPLDSLWDWAIIPGWLGEDVAEHRRRMAELDRRFRSAGGPPVLVATAALFMGECARRDGRWRTAEALFTESVEVSRACGVGAGQVLVRLAVQAAHRGDLDRATDLVRSARAAFDQAGQDAWETQWVEHCLGILAAASGQVDRAVAAFRGVAHAPFVGRGCRDAMALSAFELVEVLAGAGRSEESAAELSRLEARLDGIVDPFGLALVHRSRGLVEADVDAAVAEFRDGPGPARRLRRALPPGTDAARARRAPTTPRETQGRPRTPEIGPRHVQGTGRHPVGDPGPPGTAGQRGTGRARRRTDAGAAHPAGDARRPRGARRHVQRRGGRRAVPQRQDRGVPPEPGLPQAGGAIPDGAAERDRGKWRGTTEGSARWPARRAMSGSGGRRGDSTP